MRLPQKGPSQVVYQNKFHQVVRVPVDFGGFTKEYFVREDGQHVGLVVARDNTILLVRQYRLLIDGLSWEIPGGGVDEGESPEEAAIRECFEETGVLCRDLKPLLKFHLGLDTIHNPTCLWYTDQFTESGQRRLDQREVVDSQWVPLSRCQDMIFSEQISGSFSIVALLAYAAMQAKNGRRTGVTGIRTGVTGMTK